MFWYKHCMRKHLLYILFICYIKIPLNHPKSAVRHLCWRTRLLSLHGLVRNLRLSRCRLEMGWCWDGAMVFFFQLSQIYLLKNNIPCTFVNSSCFNTQWRVKDRDGHMLRYVNRFGLQMVLAPKISS